MKVPLSWLKEYIDLNLTPAEIANKLTLAGLEVEGYHTNNSIPSEVVVGQVLEVEKHPNADKLVVAQVTNGKETLQIVCGAANCRRGLKVALAQIGAILKGNDGQEIQIKKSKIRGVESSGMLCAADELGLEKESVGILELPNETIVGTSLAELYADTIFDISLTPNLSHCTSILGVARELSAITSLPYRLPAISVKEENDESYENSLGVKILNPEDCPRYACRLIKNVRIEPSPEWLKHRLTQCGLRSVNNIVDITNYVLLELGHPLHAFDYDRIQNQQIVVRHANEGESIQTLEGKKRQLEENDLIIADSSRPIAIAGVMGGANSEVNDETKHVVLECAYFDPISIRKTSKALGLSTDASKRFERGTDPNQVLMVLDRATGLIEMLAGGTSLKGNVDVKFKEFPPAIVPCRLNRINQILGTNLSRGEVENIFHSLGFEYRWDGPSQFLVTVPTYRVDIKEEIDLIEEAARLYGYENIAKTNAPFYSSRIPSTPLYLFEQKVQNCLIAQGLQEFLTCDLIGPSLLNLVQDESIAEEAMIKVLNPTSIEQSVLRTSLLPGLLEVVKHNIDHQNDNIAGFETGRIHFKEGSDYKEPTVVGIILTGKSGPPYWNAKSQDFDFFDLKGIVENLFRELGIRYPVFKNLNIKTLHSGRQASVFVDSLEVGSIGEIHPAIQHRLDINQRVLFGEFNLDDLMQVAKPVEYIRPLINFPGMERDWTITIKESVPYTAVIDAIISQASPILEDVFLLDIYRSEKLPAGFQNLTLRFKYRDPSKTLELETVETVHHRLINEVIKRFKEEIKN